MERRAIYVSKLSSVAVLLLLLAGCSSDTGRSADQAASTVETVSTSRLLDPAGSRSAVQASYETYDDFGEFATFVDVVFIGRITGTTETPVKELLVPDGPSGGFFELDEINFAVEEVLSGKLLGDQKRTTIMHPAVFVVPAEQSRAPVRVPPINVLSSGIRAADQGSESARYLVFARYSTFAGETILSFVGPGSVAEIAPDGSIVATGTVPFMYTKKADSLYGIDITVDVVRDWINGAPPELEEPLPEARPGPGDGEYPDDPVSSAAREIEYFARLVDRDGLPVIEVTLIKVPEGTEAFEIYVNDNLRAGGTYVQGAVAVLRADEDTAESGLLVAAIDADGNELGRSAAQRIDSLVRE